jgi:general secretion pathway protein L
LSTFFRWWLDELTALIPPQLRPRTGLRHNRLVLEVVDEALDIVQCQAASRQELLRVPFTADAWDDQQLLVDELALAPEVLEGTTLRLPATRALRRVLHLPRAVQENLSQVLRFEMDRLTPFSNDDVYFDFRLIGEAEGRDKIDVELTLVPRSYLDPLLAKVKGLGFRPEIVDVSPTGDQEREGCARPSINLLPQGQGKRKEHPVCAATSPWQDSPGLYS